MCAHVCRGAIHPFRCVSSIFINPASRKPSAIALTEPAWEQVQRRRALYISALHKRLQAEPAFGVRVIHRDRRIFYTAAGFNSRISRGAMNTL